MLLDYLDRAHAADRFRKRHRRAHRDWGNGSLSAAILAEFPPRAEPFLSDQRYVTALAEVFDVIIEWRLSRQRSDIEALSVLRGDPICYRPAQRRTDHGRDSSARTGG